MADTKKRPVMVWIHGGSYTTGSGNGENDIYGPNNLIDRDIVLVSINYRLSVMGKLINSFKSITIGTLIAIVVLDRFLEYRRFCGAG